MNHMQLAARAVRNLRLMIESEKANIEKDRLAIVIRVPVSEAHGLSPGLYRVGPQGSDAGVYVWDETTERMPRDRFAPWALEIGGEARPDEGWHVEARPAGQVQTLCNVS